MSEEGKTGRHGPEAPVYEDWLKKCRGFLEIQEIRENIAQIAWEYAQKGERGAFLVDFNKGEAVAGQTDGEQGTPIPMAFWPVEAVEDFANKTQEPTALEALKQTQGYDIASEIPVIFIEWFDEGGLLCWFVLKLDTSAQDN